MNERVYWIWLSLACVPDTLTFSKLIKRFEDPITIYNATERELCSCLGSTSIDCAPILNKDLTRARAIYDFCTSKGVGIVTYSDPDFPDALRKIKTPPVLLYYRGHFPDYARNYRCAIVGTRSLTQYGRKHAFELGYQLSCAGATIVSGMAKGIDGVAMAGALSAGHPVIGVLGSGIDVCYPKEHLKLAREIVKEGCIITEYAPGTKPERYNFPRRNRLISGLCESTVFVEGSMKSGAMITARHAKEQGRVLYCFPGNVDHESSDGTNFLIREGARFYTGAQHIVEDVEKLHPGTLNPYEVPFKVPCNVMDALREYQVSAITNTDDIFNHPKPKKNDSSVRKSASVQNNGTAIAAENNKNGIEGGIDPQNYEELVMRGAPLVSGSGDDGPSLLPEMPAFDKESLEIYKKIPRGEEFPVESLIDEDHDYRAVTKILLKLRMAKFVEVLPGDRVKRIM